MTDLRPACAVNTKLSADWLQRKLWEQLNVRAAPIHGDLSQYQRQKALQQFRDGRVRVLVATDVAARGLDIPSVGHVVNFDLPAHIDDYTHRVGRTGRAGHVGRATALFDTSAARGGDWGIAPHLRRALSAAKQEVPAFLQVSKAGGRRGGRGAGGRRRARAGGRARRGRRRR